MKHKRFNKCKTLIKIYAYSFLCIKGITGLVFAIKDICDAKKLKGAESDGHT